MYTVSVGSTVNEFEKRAEAIKAAKDMSVESRQAVLVQDEDQRERMSYMFGELESYTYETRHRRGRDEN